MAKRSISLSHCVYALVLFPELARAADMPDGEDFSNNLFSDLAPLLTLFGERVTTQFLSQTTGWADCVIFAMAPLGIVTAVVSAIRVGGPGWLRALIGRARENLVTAELELMSSTSKETCELWNRDTVVRCQGKGSVWEFICIRSKDDALQKPSRVRVMTLEEALKTGLMRRLGTEHGSHIRSSCEPKVGSADEDTEKKSRGSWRQALSSVFNKRTVSHETIDPESTPTILETDSKMPLETVSQQPQRLTSCNLHAFQPGETVVIRNRSNFAPNLSLNGNGNVSSLELWLAAIFGTFLQLGVLIYFGLLIHHPSLRHLKDSKPIDGYALPLSAGGTVAMVLGVLVCAHVVDASTHEDRYVACEEGHAKARIVWLQQSMTVNEQYFESLAAWPSKHPRTISTSQRTHRRGDAPESLSKARAGLADEQSSTSTEAPPKGLVASIRRLTKSFSSLHFALETQAVLGAGVSLVGFVVQFTGLRGMHWSASVAQLTAILVMSTLRAMVRRTLGRRLEDQELPKRYELDWFTWSIEDPKAAPWSSGDRDQDSEMGIIGTWSILTGNSSESLEALKSSPAVASPHGTPSSSKSTAGPKEMTAQQIVSLRKDLALLASWKGPLIAEARCLASAIKVTMDALFMAPKGIRHYTWSIGIARDHRVETIRFHVNYRNGSWVADVNELEAALSLWLYHTTDQSSSRNSNPRRHQSESKETTQVSEELPLADLRLKLLGPCQTRLVQDLQWWMPDGLHGVFKGEERADTDADMNLTSVKTISVGNSGRRKITQDHQADSNSGDAIIKGPDLPTKGTQEHPETQPANTGSPQIQDVAHISQATSEIQPGKAPLVSHWALSPLQEDDPGNENMEECFIVVKSNGTLEKLYAQDLFSAFVWSLAGTENAGLLHTEAKLDVDESKGRGRWNEFKLGNQKMHNLARDIETTGLGSVLDAFVCLIPPLSAHFKLPRLNEVTNLVCERAIHLENLQDWEGAGNIYQGWLLDTAMKFPTHAYFYRKTVAVLLSFQARLDLESRLLGDDRYQPNSLSQQLEKTEEILSNMDAQVLKDLTSYRNMSYHFRAYYTKKDINSKVNPSRDAEATLKALGISQDSSSESIEARDIFDMTPLHYATLRAHNVDLQNDDTQRSDDEEFMAARVKPLLKDRQTADSLFGWTTQHTQALFSNAREYESMLLDGARPDTRDLSGMTPLHHACLQANPLSRIKIHKLWKYKADLNAEAIGGLTPIHCAALSNDSRVVRELLEIGADPMKQDASGRTAHHYAAFIGSVTATTALTIHRLEASEPLRRDKHGRFPIHIAALEGHVELISDYWSEIDLSDDLGLTPLHAACLGGHVEFVERLLSEGVARKVAHLDVAQDGDSDVQESRVRNIQTVITANWLLSQNLEGRTPFHLAAQRGHVRTIRALINAAKEAGVEVQMIKATDNERCTSLHLAADHEWLNTVHLLLREGADVNARDEDGKTPLHWVAAGHGKEKLGLLQLLLENGADTECLDGRNWKPLEMAAFFGDSEGVELLFEADKSTDQNLALVAASRSHIGTEVARFLISKGAGSDLRNDDGETLKEMVDRGDDKDVQDFILGLEAKGWPGWGRGRKLQRQ